ncbi:MAG TPA: nitronate monooxygenase [Pirellulales bacterium]|nr:nitronate monooxygenase [Pirellulales bacterium]
MLDTRLTTMLRVQHPIMLAGMAGVSYAGLVGAMSEAGGYGVLGAGNMALDELSAEMQKVRALTSKPFGVDLLAPMTDNPEDEAQRIIDGGVTCFVTGPGLPSRVIRLYQKAAILVFCVCTTVRQAVEAEDAGCDAVVAQGTEAGGHTGAVGTMALCPQVVDRVKIPVIAAGGIYDGRGLAAALALGCEGVWIGTRFVACHEARAAKAYQGSILRANESDTIVSRCWTGKPLRALKSPTIEQWEQRPQDIQSFPQQDAAMRQAGLLGFLDPEAAEREPRLSCFPAGQGCGGITKVESCREIVDGIMRQAVEVLAAQGARAKEKARPAERRDELENR